MRRNRGEHPQSRGEPHCMVVIAANHERSAGMYKLDDRRRVGTIVDQIAQHPQLVVVLRQGLKRFKICVKVGDDADSHSLIPLAIKNWAGCATPPSPTGEV